MPRRGERSKGLGYKKPVKKAKVDLVSSPLTEPLQDVVVVTPDDLLLGNNKSYKERRALIASYYAVILNSPPPEEWRGYGGTAAIICNALCLPKGSNLNVLRVLKYEHLSAISNKIYDGKRHGSSGVKEIINLSDTLQIQIIIDAMSSGLGIAQTHQVLNTHRAAIGLPIVCQSTVYNVVKYQLRPKIDKVGKRKQGSTDPEHEWSKARCRWTSQLLIRLGLKQVTEDAEDFYKDLPPLDINQIVFWDEMHKEQVIGYSGGRSYRFKVDSAGKFDPINGKIPTEAAAILHMKYPQQARLCFGVAAVRLIVDEAEEGRRCTPFDYTGKTVVTILDYKQLIEKEIRRVKNLKVGGSGWVHSLREPGEYWEEELLSTLSIPGFGKKTIEKLKCVNILTVGQIKNMTTNQSAAIVSTVIVSNRANGIKMKTLTDLQGVLSNAKAGDVPIGTFVDHRKHSNPYQSRYGEAWEAEIKQVGAMKKIVCIKELITHVVEETRRVMRGTKFEDNFYFYHDALSLMTAAETRKWMLEMDYEKYWLLPMKDLNKGTTYHNRPVGDSPEMMPLDCSLFNDLHEGANRHVSLTHLLHKDDPKKFSLATPKEISRAYCRLWTGGAEEGSPTCERIIQDCNKFVRNIQVINDAKGIMCSGLGNRRGHRKENAVGVGKSNRGGARKSKGQQSAPWIHADADGCYELFIAASQERLTSLPMDSPNYEEEEEEIQTRSNEENYDSNDDDSISCFGDDFFMECGERSSFSLPEVEETGE